MRFCSQEHKVQKNWEYLELNCFPGELTSEHIVVEGCTAISGQLVIFPWLSCNFTRNFMYNWNNKFEENQSTLRYHILLSRNFFQLGSNYFMKLLTFRLINFNIINFFCILYNICKEKAVCCKRLSCESLLHCLVLDFLMEISIFQYHLFPDEELC